MIKIINLTPYFLHHFFLIGIMVSPIHNLLKLIFCIFSFLLVFKRLNLLEWSLFFGVSVFFTFMNAMAIQNGVFQFLSPDFLGLPWYEFLMWGMYVLHLKRFVEIYFADELNNFKISYYDFICLFLVAIFFSVCGLKWQITILPLLVNIFYLTYKNSKLLWLSYLYFIFMGGVLEFIGTRYLEWSYPSPDIAGVPLWYINVFGSFAIYFPLVFTVLKSLMTSKSITIRIRNLVSRN